MGGMTLTEGRGLAGSLLLTFDGIWESREPGPQPGQPSIRPGLEQVSSMELAPHFSAHTGQGWGPDGAPASPPCPAHTPDQGWVQMELSFHHILTETAGWWESGPALSPAGFCLTPARAWLGALRFEGLSTSDLTVPRKVSECCCWLLPPAFMTGVE